MADFSKRYPDNVPGEFFVDQNCIYCGLCANLAPNNFCFSAGKDHYIVFKQPDNEKEKKLCFLALETCPVEAIGRKENSGTSF